MKNQEKEIQAINKLIEINNDRVQGYKTASDETDHGDLKQLFSKYNQQSSQFASELSARVASLGGKPETGTTTSGKVYRAWMDVKAAISNKERKAILNSCEFGEDAALSAYRTVLEDNDIPVETRQLLDKQHMELKRAHDEVKSLRDSQVA